MTQRLDHRAGFTLVELAIVLTIIGLLVGGVIVGATLIRGGELRSVTSEYQRYTSALTTFRDKYFNLPGDINNAASLWGADADGCPGTNAAITYATGTCNGDADGIFEANATSSNELFRAWQQMAYAGMIEGVYSGVANSATATHDYALIGTNVPRSKMTNGGWSLDNRGVVAISSVTYFEGTYNNVLWFGAGVSNALTTAAIMKAEDAYNLDTKLDDGKPGSGVITTLESSSNCHGAGTSNSVALAGTATYTLTNTNIGCALIFKTNTY